VRVRHQEYYIRLTIRKLNRRAAPRKMPAATNCGSSTTQRAELGIAQMLPTKNSTVKHSRQVCLVGNLAEGNLLSFVKSGFRQHADVWNLFLGQMHSFGVDSVNTNRGSFCDHIGQWGGRREEKGEATGACTCHRPGRNGADDPFSPRSAVSQLSLNGQIYLASLPGNQLNMK